MQETQRTEFKALWRDDYLRWICGFAIAKGEVTGVVTTEVATKVRRLLAVMNGVVVSGSAAQTTQETAQETTQEKVLALLRANPAITRNGLAEKLGQGKTRLVQGQSNG